MSDSRYFAIKQEIMRAAEAYCELNSLSVEKLHKQVFSLASNCAVFSQQQSGLSDGLKNDVETLPTPTLIINFTDSGFEIEETDQTKISLAKVGIP